MSIENDFALISDFDKNYCLQVFAPLPVAFVKGKGSYLYDTQGTKYLDMIGGIAVNSLGHGNPKLTSAIAKQAKDLIHCSNYYYIPQRSELAYRLCRASFADKAFFCNSGAEANEAAIKLARGYFHYKEQDKFEIITAEKSFHGRTYGSMSATGQEKFSKPFAPVVPGFKYVPFNDIDALKMAITPKTAAIMLELIQGESGVNPADIEYIKEIKKICIEKDILLIFDEVQTGIGRTGKMFCYQHYGVTPDIMTLAKGLGGGVPIGAMLCTDEAAKGFKPGDHGSTFGGNPLACAAGIAVMEYFGEANVLDNVNEVSVVLFEKLNKLKNKYSCIKNVRGMGLLIGIEFDDSVIASGLREELFRNGFLVSAIGRSVIRIAPPLILTKIQATQFVKALGSLLSTRMGVKPNPILNAIKNIGRKETPMVSSLAEEKPAETKPALPELPAHASDDEDDF